MSPKITRYSLNSIQRSTDAQMHSLHTHAQRQETHPNADKLLWFYFCYYCLRVVFPLPWRSIRRNSIHFWFFCVSIYVRFSEEHTLSKMISGQFDRSKQSTHRRNWTQNLILFLFFFFFFSSVSFQVFRSSLFFCCKFKLLYERNKFYEIV